ncbi:MAG: hypothetical protein QMD04_04410 [Anaerolineales bacterium]|nr:hypothetical protein [Anaerolineales bacterium]
MTLVVALKAPDCIILASDSRIHYPKTGFYQDTMKKIIAYDDVLLAGGLGTEMFISSLDANLAGRVCSQEKHIQTLEEALEEFKKAAIEEWQSFTSLPVADRKLGVGFFWLDLTKMERHKPLKHCQRIRSRHLLGLGLPMRPSVQTVWWLLFAKGFSNMPRS